MSSKSPHCCFFLIPCSASSCPLFYLFLLPLPSLCLLIPCGCGLAAAGGLPDVLLCWTGPRGLLEKELCAASADRLTQPLPASDPLLTGSPVCQGRKKCKQRGSVHPGAEHRTLFILSPMLLPESPIPASGWLYLKFTNIPLSEVLRSFGCSIPSFQWCLKDELCQCCPQAGEVKNAGFKYLYDVCLAQPHLWHLSCYIRREIEEQGSRINGQLPVEL